MVAAFIVAFALVAIAEFGDKTQMLTLVLSARYGSKPVLVGVAIAILALQLVAVAAGGLVGALIPRGVLAVLTGVLFVGFGLWTLFFSGKDEDLDEEADKGAGRGPIVGTALAFFLAELGDKTQIMTMTIAADPGAAARSLGTLGDHLAAGTGPLALVAVWLGSTAGMLLVNGAAALVGTALGSRLSPRLIQRVSGGIFLVFGVLTLAAYFFGG